MSNLFKLFLFFIKHRDSVIRSLNISADVILGSGCSLHRGVTILSGTRIGRGVKLYRDVYCGKNTIIGDYFLLIGIQLLIAVVLETFPQLDLTV